MRWPSSWSGRSFAAPDFEQLKAVLKQPVIFDGRNLYNPELLQRAGFAYYGVGRGLALGSKK